MGAKSRKDKLIMVGCWFNPKSFQAVCESAKKAGFRPALMQARAVKEKGFPGEMVWQTHGISTFLKTCWQFWEDHTAERKMKEAELAMKKKLIAEEEKKLGLG